MNYFSALHNLFIKRNPILIYHKPTLSCNCKCETCDTWSLDDENIMSLEMIFRLLEDARRSGIQNYTAWGGEPLLYSDLDKIFYHTKKMGMKNSICTNAYLLKEKTKEIAPNLDLALISIDAIGEDHDRIRGVEGLYKKILEGLEELRKYSKVRINIWTTINPVSRYQIEEILKVAEFYKVIVEFFPIAPIEGYNDKMILKKEELIDVFKEIKSLKNKDYPVGNTNYYLDLVINQKPFKCNFPLISLFVNPDGTIYTCEEGGARIIKKWGKYPELTLAKLLSSNEYHETVKKMENCNKCFLPCVGETSGFLPLQIIRKKISILNLSS
ncbi:MAG: DUF3463 domain-containing protein [Candidatus Coatesbacteria bacterium]|nr:DUF3463 domain-containing protein [Candidatus Coatesbacteria bacterium]